jgi:hypothetical protein
MNLQTIQKLDQEVLNNRGNNAKLDEIIKSMEPILERYDWEMNKFLTDHCHGVKGIEATDLDTSNPIYRYYNHKCSQYAAVKRIVRIAEAYKV